MKKVALDRLPRQPLSHDTGIQKRVFAKNGDIPHLTQLARSYFKGGQAVELHEHRDMYEVFLVEEGNGIIQINGQEFSLRPGDCVTVEPGEKHSLRCDRKSFLVLTYFGISV